MDQMTLEHKITYCDSCNREALPECPVCPDCLAELLRDEVCEVAA